MICFATIEDLSTIVEIYNASIPARLATADLEPITPDSRRDWFESHSPHSHPLWVFKVANRVVGWLSLRPFYGRAAYKSTAEVSVYVAPEYHRQNIGRQLLDRAIDNCPHLGIYNLVGFIFAHNQPSLKLFMKVGFIQWGYLPGIAELNGIDRDLVILGLKLEAEYN
jgi:L-amino acid N-acyltransferase YncA